MSYMNRVHRDPGGAIGGAHSARQGASRRGRPAQASRKELDRLEWERAMKRLNVLTRALAAVLLALFVRMVVLGVTVPIALTTSILAVLLIASVLLARRGKRLGI